MRPTGTEPGCHVAVARPSIVPTFPATPFTTVCEPVDERRQRRGGDDGRRDGSAPDAEPPAPEAVTTSSSVEPRSSGVGV